MVDWSKGYVSDIAYTAGFYRETAPAHMAFAALMLGRGPGRALRPRRVLELGFGQGFGLALIAAANPDVQFEGSDFNPEHVSNARRLIAAAGLGNLSVSEASFEDAAGRGGDSDVDVIVAHGILSWVDADARKAMVAIARQRLQPEGFLYASYNCMPGWAPLAPIRQMLMQAKKRTAGRSDTQVAAGLELLAKLRAGNAVYFAANPAAAQHADQMLALDRRYLAHEYLHENWTLFEFADVVAMLGEAKLGYVCSATLLENFDAYAVPAGLAPLMAETRDPVLKETLRDFAASRRFRRDIYARGAATPTTAEHRRLLSQLSFVLAVPKEKVAYKVVGPLSELTAKEEFHRPIIQAIGDRVARFDDLVTATGGVATGVVLDCLAFHVAAGQVLVVVGDGPVDPLPARRFNRAVIDDLKAGRIYNALASPVARTGVAANEFQLLALAAILDDKAGSPSAAATYALAMIKGMGRRPIKDGRLIEDDSAGTAFLEERLTPVLADSPVVWRRLGIL